MKDSILDNNTTKEVNISIIKMKKIDYNYCTYFLVVCTNFYEVSVEKWIYSWYHFNFKILSFTKRYY